MISELHFAWLVHRAQAGARSRPRPEGEGECGADAVSVEQIVHWATAGGAGVLGFEGVGTLQAMTRTAVSGISSKPRIG
ncbi:hypothetical protein [Variovorax soli]|uniref:Cytosine/adenosine deaminase-related metal-dependent hydrolase n=1 Tax=Variovorax soli TaxID=376815 RepID=A0ABU1NJN8_9BURK|nr:hypothetical protein [Variovorax soli]MDR6538588.1 cytosine/adenosine deaminase-related metal-dependent hydrolase [Variovorax soli]